MQDAAENVKRDYIRKYLQWLRLKTLGTLFILGSFDLQQCQKACLAIGNVSSPVTIVSTCMRKIIPIPNTWAKMTCEKQFPLRIPHSKMSSPHFARVVLLLHFIVTVTEAKSSEYYGVEIGEWKGPVLHGLEGRIYAIDEDEIFIKGFTYDGAGAAWFRTAKRGDPGVTDIPNNSGVRVPYPTGFSYTPENSPKLKSHENKDVILKLPYNIDKVQWFQVYSEDPAVSFGHILIPPGFLPPAIATLASLTENAHGLSSGKIQVYDHRTIHIPDLHYDGEEPHAYFLVGPSNGSSKPNKKGIKIADQRGNIEKLSKFTGQGVTLVLPDYLSINKIKWLSVFSLSTDQNFGDIRIPKNLRVPRRTEKQHIGDNCVNVIEDKIQLEWEVSGDTVYFRLWAAIEDTQWAGIGFKSGEDESEMIGSDAIIIYQVPYHQRQFYAQDYYLSSYEVCSRKAGVCPDVVFESDVGQDNVDVDQSRSDRVDGVSLVTFSRLLVTTDAFKDIQLNQTLKLFGAFGERNTKSKDVGLIYEQILPHKGNNFVDKAAFISVDFREDRVHTCSLTLREVLETRRNRKKVIKPVPFPKTCLSETKEFEMDIGPTGGERGYEAITGQQSWGFSIWVNGKLAPELCLRRGETYTFNIHGGTNSRGNGMNFHPIYITDDYVGGYRYKDKDERAKVKVIRGVNLSNSDHPEPIWTGQYCEWMTKDLDDPEKTEKAKDYCEFRKSLERRCDPIDAKKKPVRWTITDEILPKTLYYQCYIHSYYGWKIHIIEEREACPCWINTSSRLKKNLYKLIAAGLLITHAMLKQSLL